MVLGKLIHYGVDAILISVFLAGVKRSTGLTLKSDKVESNGAIDKYLNFGEMVMDQSIAFLGTSGYFERKRR